MKEIRNIKVFLIHGFQGVPNGGWRSWLMGQLSEKDIYACSLSMPNPYEPKLTEWLEEIKRVVERNPNDDIYLVGHSLGGTAILHFVEKYNFPNLKGFVSVSAPCGGVNNDKIKEFLDKDFDFKLIREKVNKIAVIHGDDDPLVPVSQAEKIAKETQGKLIIIPNGQHLNGSAGFVTLPECLEVLEGFFKN